LSEIHGESFPRRENLSWIFKKIKKKQRKEM
jgi:hypothetical protein